MDSLFDTAPKPEQTPATIQTPDVANTLQSALELTQKFWPEATRREKAVTEALVPIVSISNDEEDKAAAALLLKVRNTLTPTEADRKEITKITDGLKSILMTPEKSMSGQYERVVGLRNIYANEKLKQQQAEQAAAMRKQALDTEKIRLKSVFEEKVRNGLIIAEDRLRGSISSFIDAITLETYDEKVKKFNIAPKLAEAVYNDWFTALFNSAVMSADEFKKLVDEVKCFYTYENVNSEYLKKAMPIIESVKADLPELKVRLQEVENLRVKDAAAAAELEKKQKEESEKKRQEEKEAFEKQQKLNAAKIQEAAQNAALDATFDAEVAMQESQADLKNTRKTKHAVIECEPGKEAVVLGEVMWNCLNHPAFEGIYKKTPLGTILVDGNGIPECNAWAKKLLTFFAANCSNTAVPGIVIKETVSTIQKETKGTL